MKTRSVYIMVLGVICLAAIGAAVYISKQNASTQLGIVAGGMIAIAAFVVGALATLAHEQGEIYPLPPAEDWPSPNDTAIIPPRGSE